MVLTPKRQRFVEEYIVDLNATQAAIRAGYAARSADVTGSRLLGNARVSAAVQEAQAARSKRTEMSQDWIIDHLRENVGAAKAEAQYNASNKALELLGKHLGMFTERVDHNHRTPEGPIEIAITHRVVDPAADRD